MKFSPEVLFPHFNLETLKSDVGSVMIRDPGNGLVSSITCPSTVHSSAILPLGRWHVKHTVVLSMRVRFCPGDIIAYGPSEQWSATDVKVRSQCE